MVLVRNKDKQGKSSASLRVCSSKNSGVFLKNTQDGHCKRESKNSQDIPRELLSKGNQEKKLENIMWKEKQNIGEESLRQQKL